MQETCIVNEHMYRTEGLGESEGGDDGLFGGDVALEGVESARVVVGREGGGQDGGRFGTTRQADYLKR